MTRETKKITLPISGYIVEMYTYITGRDRRIFNAIYASQEEKGKLFQEAEDATLKSVVVSIDGKKDGEDNFSLIDFILELDARDYDCLVTEARSIVFEKKTN